MEIMIITMCILYFFSAENKFVEVFDIRMTYALFLKPRNTFLMDEFYLSFLNYSICTYRPGKN